MSLLCCSVSLSSARRASVARRDLSSWEPSSNSSSFTCHVPAMTGFIHLHVTSLWALGFSQHSCWFNIPNWKPRQKLWGFCCPSPGSHTASSPPLVTRGSLRQAHIQESEAEPTFRSRRVTRPHCPAWSSEQLLLWCFQWPRLQALSEGRLGSIPHLGNRSHRTHVPTKSLHVTTKDPTS